LYLERLEEKYGPLPSILATRADYLESGDAERETLLLSAHSAAESDGDVVNLLCSAQSVVELFLEWRRLSDADLWLRRLREYLDRYGENHVKYSDYENLRAEYRKLAISPVNSSEQ
jgi:NADH dehydrogenase/NADH:ubiquinone oxidoreductase subunit G